MELIQNQVGPYDFNLNFTDCGAALAERGFTLTLTPVGYAGTGNNYLKNTDISSTGATNVGIQLGYGTIASSPINFNGTSDTPTIVHKTLFKWHTYNSIPSTICAD